MISDWCEMAILVMMVMMIINRNSDFNLEIMHLAFVFQSCDYKCI